MSLKLSHKWLKNGINDFLSIIYPRHCLACYNNLYKHERHVCNYCYTTLPKSQFHLQENNTLERLFYGRIPINRASSYLLFHKSSGVQKLLHSIKYKGNQALAKQLGIWYAQSLKNDSLFSDSHILVPVPLHDKKLKQRGFNQSEAFANGLSEVWSMPVVTDCLIRTDYTSTQTAKRKFDRWENVQNKFDLHHTEELRDKTLILVDDVITTGATIDACYQALSKAEGITLNVLSLAYAAKN